METIFQDMSVLKKRAFTLTELLVVISIILIVATLLIPAARSVYASSTDAVSAHVIAQLNAAAESYLADNNQIYWPYRTTTNGGVQWWFGFEPAASYALQNSAGKRWLDLSQGPLGPYIAASGGFMEDPSFTRSGKVFRPKFGNCHFAYGYNWQQLPGRSRLTINNPAQIAVFATCADVNAIQAPATAKNPMIEEQYLFDTGYSGATVHFRIGGNAMVGYADGSAGYLPMMPGTLDSRVPNANIGMLSSNNIIPQ
jgi:prepilin-type N-terminal cleavage/methylation domain-containing protein